MKKVIIFITTLIFTSVAVYTTQASSDLEDISRAREDYRFHLSLYQSDYDEFLLRQTQHGNLQTLATLEQLSTASKKVLESRVMVWWVYLQMLRVEVVNINQRVNIPELSSTINQLSTWQMLLQSHQEALTGINTIEQTRNQAEYLNQFKNELNALSYNTLAWIRWAKLHEIHITQSLLLEDLQAVTPTQIRDLDELEVRMRGFDQANIRLQQIETELEELKLQIDGVDQVAYDLERVFNQYIDQALETSANQDILLMHIKELSVGLEL